MSSDYQDSNVFGGWGERDDRSLIDQAVHDRLDVAHEVFLDWRDENLPAPGLSTGLCEGCRGNAALPESSLCADCTAEVLLVGEAAA